MSTAIKVTYEQFEEMIRRGEFDDTDDRFELLLGEVMLLPLPNPPHEYLVDVLNLWSIRSLPEDAAWVRIQNSLGIPELESLALPDLAWLRFKDYSRSRPLPEDVLLVIEVSDSTLSRDRNLKAGLYAQAGIADYWIVNVSARTVEIRRNPGGRNYGSIQVLGPGVEARPLAFPDLVLLVSRLFPD